MHMTSPSEGAYWFVSAPHGGADDRIPRFLEKGLWENDCHDKWLEEMKSIRPGDRIAIKAAYTRKHDLPFNNRGMAVSTMAIKAIGTVMENLGDGRCLKVEWTPFDPPREWYFYTNMRKFWRVLPIDWLANELIEFAFSEKSQDINRFRNAPYWRDRFGDKTVDRQCFKWTKFCAAVADKLLAFKDKRNELAAEIQALVSNTVGFSGFFSEQASGPLKDVCPFSVMALFNRRDQDSERKTMAGELASLLGVSEPVPESFAGIPALDEEQTKCAFSLGSRSMPDDMEVFWEVFGQAIRFAESYDVDARASFAAAYDHAASRLSGVAWSLSTGLHWIRPWTFPSLDSLARQYIVRQLRIQLDLDPMEPEKGCNAARYLELSDKLHTYFQEDASFVHSFPELSFEALLFHEDKSSSTSPNLDEDEAEVTAALGGRPYSVEDILKDGCFIDCSKLERILERLRVKKNLILQGPPGTGKTWLARRLAFALIGQRDDSRVRAVQFHPSLSYEDFVRGWRPAGDGRLALTDGPFLEMVKAASKEPHAKRVVVIEEINRGNPAQIFGEMLTLLEADKRTPGEALELCYRREEGECVFIPDNLHLIGTMNIADRSLALVDLALRRRFAFVDLEPALGRPWREWVSSQFGISATFLERIEERIGELNQEIASDPCLGPQFRVGHSYVTPTSGVGDARVWFRQVVETEIGPLLEECWHDDLERAQKARERLLKGL